LAWVLATEIFFGSGSLGSRIGWATEIHKKNHGWGNPAELPNIEPFKM
jgi:hypothetical protein